MTSRKKPSILFICTGNSCRSPIAEGLARSLGWKASSGGIHPAGSVSRNAVVVMGEIGLDISKHIPRAASTYGDSEIDLVVTLGNYAQRNLPVFQGNISQFIHQPFPDPYGSRGSQVEVLQAYRITRDEIHSWLVNLDSIYGK